MKLLFIKYESRDCPSEIFIYSFILKEEKEKTFGTLHAYLMPRVGAVYPFHRIYSEFLLNFHALIRQNTKDRVASVTPVLYCSSKNVPSVLHSSPLINEMKNVWGNANKWRVPQQRSAATTTTAQEYLRERAGDARCATHYPDTCTQSTILKLGVYFMYPPHYSLGQPRHFFCWRPTYQSPHFHFPLMKMLQFQRPPPTSRRRIIMRSED